MINEDIMLNSGEALKAYITGFLDFSNCHCGTLKEALKAYITGFLDAMKESLRDMTLEELQDTYHWLQGEKDNG